MITPSPPPAVAPSPSTEHLEPTGGPRPFQRSIPPFFTAIELFQDGTCTYPCFREGQGGRGKDNTETGGQFVIRRPTILAGIPDRQPCHVPRRPGYARYWAPCAPRARVWQFSWGTARIRSCSLSRVFLHSSRLRVPFGGPGGPFPGRWIHVIMGRGAGGGVAVSLCPCVPVSLPVEGAVWPRSAPVGSLPSSLFPLLSSPTSDFRLPHAPRPRSAPLTRPRTPRSQPRTCRRSVPRRSGSSESTAPVMGPV